MRRDCAETRFPAASRLPLPGKKAAFKKELPGSQLTAAVPTQEQAPAWSTSGLWARGSVLSLCLIWEERE